MRRVLTLLFPIAILLWLCAWPQAVDNSPAAQSPPFMPEVPYVPTPHAVVAEMLKLANVTSQDVVYDLGCGDGRIVIAAARDYGARGVGVDLDPERIKEAEENARKAGVADKVKFMQKDLFQTDLKDASVVTLYLLTYVNLKLRPVLWRELKPGTRIVSQTFGMGDWKPDKTLELPGRSVYLWTITPDLASKAPPNSLPTSAERGR